MRNKILCLAVVLLSSLSVFAQRPVNYTKLFHRYNYISMKADSALMLPLYDGAPVGVRGGETIRSGYIAIDSTNNVLYFYSDSAWRTVSGVNIYNSDGTLTGNRVLTGDAYSLTFTGLSSFVTAIGSTTRLSLNSTTSTMQSPDALNYFQTDNSSATMASENNYLKLYDTYVEIDTLEKGSLTDSVMVYSPSTGRVKFMDPVLLGGKVSYSDTTSMLANYLVTAGDLSPIFTTTESGHNIEFDLSNTTQYTVLGRTASGSGDPSYVSIDTTFISSFYTKVRSLFTAGTGITITNGQITSTVTGGTVTSLTASDANGFDFTITDPTTAPNISLTTSVTDTRVIYSNSGAVAGVSGFTSDGTNVTAGSNNLRATSPRITTGINDANGNELFLFTATGSAVNEITVANAATGADPTLTASGGDSNVGFNIVTKGTGAINFQGNSTQAAEIRLYEDTDNGTDYTSFKVGSQSLNVQYTLPTGYAAVNGYVLSSTTAGVMSWIAPATGTVTSFGFTDGNGFDGTVSNSTTTPTLSLTTDVSNTQVLYSNSGALAGSSQFTFTGQAIQTASTNTTQATTSSAFVGSYNSLTSGTGMYLASSSLSTGSILNLVESSTAVDESKVINIAMSGVNASSSKTSYGVFVHNNHTGTTPINYAYYGRSSSSGTNIAFNALVNSNSATNYGGYFSASGAGTATNYGLYVIGSGGTTNYAIYANGGQWVANTGTTTQIGFEIGSATTSGILQKLNIPALTSGTGLNITSSGTALASGNEGLDIAFSGANASSSITATGARVSVTNTGTSSTNLGLEISASGASTNYAAKFLRGRVGIGTAGTETGILELNGATSGTVTVKTNNTAGTWTLELPANDGDANQVLKTDGSGVTSWSAVPRYTPLVVSTTSVTTSVTIDADVTDIYVITAQAGDFTFNAPTGTIAHGQKLIIRAKCDGTQRGVTWNSVFRSNGTLALPDKINTTNDTWYCGFLYNSTDSKWDLVAYSEGY